MALTKKERESLIQAVTERVRSEVAQAPVTQASSAPATVREAYAWLTYFRIPQRLHRGVVAIVVICAVLGCLYLAWGWVKPPLRFAYKRIPIVADLNDISKELHDPKTGLAAISDDANKSRDQLRFISGFLAGKFPEFGNALLKDAKTAAREGDIRRTASLLQTATSSWQYLKAQKLEVPSDFFSAAVTFLSEIGATPAAASVGAEVHKARITLASYRSALEPLPDLKSPFQGQPVRSSGEIAHLSFDLSLSPNAQAVSLPPAYSLDALFKMLDVRIISGQQMLDNANWTDAIFVGTRVEYDGAL